MMKRSSFFQWTALSLMLLASNAAFAAAVDDDKTPVRPRASEFTEERRDDIAPYTIGSQNLLQIKIFGEAAVNQIYRVEEDGYIKHALIGRVKLGGLTVTEAEAFMEEKLGGDYIINPQVNIFVLEYSHFSIIGEVRKPGNYEISGRMSVIRAISVAGGFTPVANQRNVQVIRRNDDGTESKLTVDAQRIMSGDRSADMDLQADDVIVVSKSFF
jgi:protein involved in polysaccharide export with SLBB domain